VSLLLLLVACADYALSTGERGDMDTGSDAALDSGAADADTEEAIVADHWVLDGSVTLAEGLPAPELGALRVRTVRVSDGAPVCESAYDLDALVAADAPDDAVYAWWDGAAAIAPGCAGAPDALAIGLGALLPDLRARLGTVGHEGAADALFGAYLRHEDGAVVAFGVAGTESALRGEGVATAPPPDGAYQILPLYALPVEAE
jgi:hypothetical protein